MELISVIVPIYNTERFLDRCLNSIQKQTYQNIQVLLVDDGSTDNSAEICRNYAASDSRFQYIYQLNAGVSTARNTGLAHAKGEYIGFCDSDDWIEPDMYEELHRLIKDTGAEIAVGSYCKEIMGETCASEPRQNDEVQILSNLEALIRMQIDTNFIGFIWNKLIRRDLFDGIEFPTDITISEDTLVCGELFKKCGTIAFQKKICYHYVIHKDSAYNAPFKESFWTYQTALHRQYMQMKEFSPENAFYAQSVLIRQNLRIAEKLCKEHKLTKENYNRVFNEIQPHINSNAVKFIYNPKAKRALRIFLMGRNSFLLYRKLKKWDW